VWNHPHLTAAEAREIVEWGLGFLQSPRTFFRRGVKWQLLRVERHGRLLAPFLINRNFVRANAGGLRSATTRQPLRLFSRDELPPTDPSPTSLRPGRVLPMLSS
jgi:hypothetical protein